MVESGVFFFSQANTFDVNLMSKNIVIYFLGRDTLIRIQCYAFAIATTPECVRIICAWTCVAYWFVCKCVVFSFFLSLSDFLKLLSERITKAIPFCCCCLVGSLKCYFSEPMLKLDANSLFSALWLAHTQILLAATIIYVYIS